MWVLAMQISAVRVSAVANFFQKFSYFYKFPLHAAKYYIFIVINHIVVRVLGAIRLQHCGKFIVINGNSLCRS